MSNRNQRKTVLIRPRTQLRWGGLVLGMMALVTLFQAIAFQFLLTRASSALPNDGEALLSTLPAMLVQACLLTALFTGPLLLLAMLFLSFRILGPLHRMERHLGEVAAGGDPGPLRLRAKDQLHELADAINRALAARRDEHAAGDETAERDAA